LRTAIDSGLGWYDAIFSMHGIATALEGGIWWALDQPPRWHSAAKTIERTAPKQGVVLAVEQFEHCSVADSFGSVDLSDEGFDLLFEANWLHHRPLPEASSALPKGWSKLRTQEELERWNAEHDTSDVLLPSILRDQSFEILSHCEDGVLIGGAVLHDWGGQAIGMSNEWVVPGRELDVEALLACVSNLHEGRAVVGYAGGYALDLHVAAGFSRLGPHLIWAR
jgi:hypothetical protein